DGQYEPQTCETDPGGADRFHETALGGRYECAIGGNRAGPASDACAFVVAGTPTTVVGGKGCRKKITSNATGPVPHGTGLKFAFGGQEKPFGHRSLHASGRLVPDLSWPAYPACGG